jgi:hypothetical protein
VLPLQELEQQVFDARLHSIVASGRSPCTDNGGDSELWRGAITHGDCAACCLTRGGILLSVFNRGPDSHFGAIPYTCAQGVLGLPIGLPVGVPARWEAVGSVVGAACGRWAGYRWLSRLLGGS